METMHFHIANRTTLFRIQGVPIPAPMNNLAPMGNCLGVQGKLNWMPGNNR